MIRYQCRNCGQKIRANDDAAGKTARCPNCSNRERVPTAAALQATTAGSKPHAFPHDERESIIEEPFAPHGHHDEFEHESILENPLPTPSPLADRISYRCPSCSATLRAPRTAVGMKGRCPKCHTSAPIPVPTPSGAHAKPRQAPPPQFDHDDEHDSIFELPTAAPTSPDGFIRYFCPGCDLKLRAPQSAVGKSGRCPRCQGFATVPPTSVVPKVDARSGPTLPAPTAPDRVSLKCPHCALKWHSNRPAAGESIRCPQCKKAVPATAIKAAPTLPAPDFLPPRYEHLGELGRGSFGMVYKVRDVQLHRVVALKVMRSDVNPELLPRFRVEAQAVARMQHPNIVQIFEVAEYNGRLYCVFEYVDGGSLQEMLRGQPLPPRQAAQLIQDLSVAIHHAHQQGVVHRDIKPANILFSHKRAVSPQAHAEAASVLLMGGTLKITDFGLAKKMDEESTQTMAGALIGTPSYMAPEQAEGKDVTPCSDVYALGAVLYEMLTGAPPFVGNNAYETIHKVCFHEPVAPSKVRKNVPKDLETICLKCLEKNPNRRYASAQDLANDLGRFRAGESIQARPASVVMRSVRYVRRRPAPLLVALLMLVTAGGLALGMWYRGERDKARQQAEVEAKQREQDDRKRKEEEAERQRLVVSYFAGFVNRRGVSEGVGPITEEQARARTFSLKFSTRGGLVEKVEAVNGQGHLTPNHQVGSLLDDEHGPGRNNRECAWEFRYQDGKIAQELATDRNGLVVWSFKHTSDRTGYFCDSKGYPRSRTGSGAAYVEYDWDDNGFHKEIRYFDGEKNRRPSGGRVFGLRLERDGRGFPIKTINLDENGKPTVTKDGVAVVRSEYDGQGNAVKSSYFDAAEKPTLRQDGTHGYTTTYDERGNRVRVSYFGIDGRPCLGRDGYARWDMKYDDLGRLTRIAYFGADGRPCVNGTGEGGYEMRYDHAGNRTALEHFDVKGQPCVSQDGYWKMSMSNFHASGNYGESAYFDAKGDRMRHREGYSRYRAKHDDRGNVLERDYLDPDGKLCVTRNGYARVVNKYDDQGRLSEESYYGPDRNPTTNQLGYSKRTFGYDARGNLIEETYYGLDNQPTLRSGGFARIRSRFDEFGNRTEFAYFDEEDRPCLAAHLGVHGVTHRSDVLGNVLEESYFNINNLPCDGPNRFAKWRGRYDRRHNRIETTFYDLTDQPCLHRADYARIEATYDDFGRNTSVTTIGLDGKPRLHALGFSRRELRYDARGRQVEELYYGLDGARVAQKDGYSRYRAHFDELGNVVKREYFDVKDQSCLTTDGYAAWTGTYDLRGFRTRTEFLDANGKPVLISRGYAAMAQKRDDRGNVTEQATFDADGKLCPTEKKGYCRVVATYNVRGNRTSMEYFGTQGERVEQEGVGSLSVSWNDYGKITALTLYGAEGKRVAPERYGMSRMERTYDPRGNLTESSSFDIFDKLTLTPGGYARFRNEYQGGRLSEVKHFGLNNELVVNQGLGYARKTIAYDERGDRTERYWAPDGKRLMIARVGYAMSEKKYNAKKELREQIQTGFPASEGYFRKVIKYDDNGLVSEVAYLGRDGKPTLSPRGIARFTRKYDARGNKLEEKYFGVDGNVKANTGNTTEWRWTYGLKNELLEARQLGYPDEANGYVVLVSRYEAGRAVEVKYLDQNEKPVNCRTGYSRATREYDERGNLTDERYFGTDDKPAKVTAGYARRTVNYNGRGQRVREVYYDAEDRLVACADGYARFEAKYDDQGNPVEQAHYDADGNLTLAQGASQNADVLQKLGLPAVTLRFARGETKYDRHNRPTELAFYGPDGNLIAGLDAVAKLTIRSDENGRPTDLAFIGADGKPVAPGLMGFARLEARYDARGNQTLMATYDVSGKAVPTAKFGYAKVERKYVRRGERDGKVEGDDDAGEEKLTAAGPGPASGGASVSEGDELVEEKISGLDGSDGYRSKTLKYENGRVVEVAYFDADGKSATHRDGYHRSKADYDAEGNQTSESYFGADGKPCLYKSDYASWTAKYDTSGSRSDQALAQLRQYFTSTKRNEGAGNRVEYATFGLDGKPVVAEVGYARAKWSYDGQKKMVTATYFDARDRPIRPKVVVTAVADGSDAHHVGLRKGDVLETYGNRQLPNQYAFQTWLSDERADDKPRVLTIDRSGRGVKLTVPPQKLTMNGLSLEDRLPKPRPAK